MNTHTEGEEGKLSFLCVKKLIEMFARTQFLFASKYIYVHHKCSV